MPVVLKTDSKGSALPMVLGLGAIIILVGSFVLFSSEAPSDELQSATEDASSEARLAGDPELENMDDADMAADGPQDLPPEFAGPGNQTPFVEGPSGPPPSVDEMDDPQASDSPPVSAGTFEDYSASKLALAEAGDVVLFFHADWCPSCRGLENDINANLANIPPSTHILKVDYDTATELKKQYGVVRQHTLVQVDAGGNEIKTLTGLTNTLSQVVSQI